MWPIFFFSNNKKQQPSLPENMVTKVKQEIMSHWQGRKQITTKWCLSLVSLVISLVHYTVVAGVKNRPGAYSLRRIASGMFKKLSQLSWWTDRLCPQGPWLAPGRPISGGTLCSLCLAWKMPKCNFQWQVLEMRLKSAGDQQNAPTWTLRHAHHIPFLVPAVG